MRDNDVVCVANVFRYYGDKPDLIEKYRQISESGKCPFCEGNIVNKFVGKTEHWNIVFCEPPYKNTRLHLLILPKRHVISFNEFRREELADLLDAVGLATNKYPFLDKGLGLPIRVKEVGGVTLFHLHWHLIAPEIGENGQIPVNFGIG